MRNAWKDKEVTPAQAAQLVKSGDTVYIGSCTSYAKALTRALAGRSEELENITLACFNILSDLYPLDSSNPGAFHIVSPFMGVEERRAMKMGIADYTSFHLSQIRRWCEETVPADIAFLDVSLPDQNGYCSFGATGCCLHSIVAATAKITVLQINRFAPYVYGQHNKIHLSEADYLVWQDEEKDELVTQAPDATVQKIAGYLVEQIPDGACIQLGFGGVATAVGYGLETKNELGVHSELVSDSIMHLMKMGVVTNRHKTFLPGRTAAGFACGSRELYRELDHNASFYFLPFPILNDPRVIAQNKKMISINSLVSIDLLGQAASESIMTRPYSGIGGQGDYVRGAQFSEGGKSFLAFTSTAGMGADGRPISRIRAALPPGTPITTPRSDVQYVVTEYGCVNLKALTCRNRMRALISIAHPDCRQTLKAEAARIWGAF